MECEGDICDSSSCVNSVGPHLSPERVVLPFLPKRILCVWCVHVCVWERGGPICVHKPVYKLKTRRCKIPAMETYFYYF